MFNLIAVGSVYLFSSLVLLGSCLAQHKEIKTEYSLDFEYHGIAKTVLWQDGQVGARSLPFENDQLIVTKATIFGNEVVRLYSVGARARFGNLVKHMPTVEELSKITSVDDYAKIMGPQERAQVGFSHSLIKDSETGNQKTHYSENYIGYSLLESGSLQFVEVVLFISEEKGKPKLIRHRWIRTADLKPSKIESVDRDKKYVAVKSLLKKIRQKKGSGAKNETDTLKTESKTPE